MEAGANIYLLPLMITTEAVVTESEDDSKGAGGGMPDMGAMGGMGGMM